MTKRTKFLGVVMLALAGGVSVAAQQPAAPAQAAAAVPEDQQPTDSQLTRLFDVMRVKEQMAAMTKMMPQIMQQQFAQQVNEMKKDHPELAKLTPAQQQAFSRVMGNFMGQAMSLYSSDDVVADLKGIYKRHLTQSDVENIIGFYGSPSGQHMLDMAPVMMQEFIPSAMQKIQERMKPLIVQMQKDLAQITASPAGSESKPDQK